MTNSCKEIDDIFLPTLLSLKDANGSSINFRESSGCIFQRERKKNCRKIEHKGWIKNSMHEKVEALITGEENDVNDFIQWCKKGPERAKVKEVIVSKQADIFFEGFEVKR